MYYGIVYLKGNPAPTLTWSEGKSPIKIEGQVKSIGDIRELKYNFTIQRLVRYRTVAIVTYFGSNLKL